MYMWWWKSADILHEHKLSTPHGPYWRFTDYVIWLIKIYFYKGCKTIYYKNYEKNLHFTHLHPVGPTHATRVARSSCRISLLLLRERAGAPWIHWEYILKNKRKLVLCMALCVFLRILFTGLAVLILTIKGLLKTIWIIMTHHAINKGKMPWN